MKITLENFEEDRNEITPVADDAVEAIQAEERAELDGALLGDCDLGSVRACQWYAEQPK